MTDAAIRKSLNQKTPKSDQQMKLDKLWYCTHSIACMLRAKTDAGMRPHSSLVHHPTFSTNECFTEASHTFRPTRYSLDGDKWPCVFGGAGGTTAWTWSRQWWRLAACTRKSAPAAMEKATRCHVTTAEERKTFFCHKHGLGRRFWIPREEGTNSSSFPSRRVEFQWMTIPNWQLGKSTKEWWRHSASAIKHVCVISL